MPDFQRIVLDLWRVFGNCRRIAKILHHGNPDYLTKLSRGEISDPRYKLGADLIELYKKHVGEDIPMVGAMQQKKLI